MTIGAESERQPRCERSHVRRHSVPIGQHGSADRQGQVLVPPPRRIPHDGPGNASRGDPWHAVPAIPARCRTGQWRRPGGLEDRFQHCADPAALRPERAGGGYLVDRAVQPDGATVSLEGWSAPAVEVEVGIRVGPLDDEGAPTVVGLAPALELVDLGIPFDDIERVLADNICQRGVVFGEDRRGIDPFGISVSATKNGQPAGDGSLVEGPVVTATFVRDFLKTHGEALEPGQRIIAGSLTPPITVATGDALYVTFGPLGALSVTFS